jgi:hypothetical protein
MQSYCWSNVALCLAAADKEFGPRDVDTGIESE